MFSLLEGFSSMLTLIRSPGHNSVQPQTLAYNAALHACFLSNVPRNGNCRKERLWCCGDVLCLSLQIWKEGCPWNKASQIVCLTVTELRSLTFKLRAGNITSAWQEAIETFAAGWCADESDTVSMQALLEAILGAGEFRRATTVTMFPPSWTLQISPWKTWWLRGVPSSSRMRQWKNTECKKYTFHGGVSTFSQSTTFFCICQRHAMRWFCQHSWRFGQNPMGKSPLGWWISYQCKM